MGFWSKLSNKVSKAIDAINGETLDVSLNLNESSISNAFNPEGREFTARMDNWASELADRQVDTMAVRHEGHNAIREGAQVEGERLLGTARRMDEKGEKNVGDMRARYGNAIVDDAFQRVDFENKVYSQLPDAALKDNLETRPDTPEAQYKGGYEARKTGLLQSLKTLKDRGIDAASAFFDRAAKLAENVRDGIEDGVAAGINGVASAGKAISNGVVNTGKAIGEVGVIGAALAVNAAEAAVDGVNNNVVQPTKQIVMKGVQNVQIGTKMAVNDFNQKREELKQRAVDAKERFGAFVERKSNEMGAFVDRKVDAANKWADDRAADLEGLKNDAIAFKNEVKQGAKETYNDLEARAKAGVQHLQQVTSKENIASKLNEAAQSVDAKAQAKAGVLMDKAISKEQVVSTGFVPSMNGPTKTEMSMSGKLNEKAAYAVNEIGSKFSGMLSRMSQSLTSEKATVRNGIQVTGFNTLADEPAKPAAPEIPTPATTKGTVEMTFTSDTSSVTPPTGTPKGVGARPKGAALGASS